VAFTHNKPAIHFQKLDPNQFLRVHGIPLKIHIDPAIAVAAEGPQSMQPWQGNAEITIDRFDVRAHLDIIPENINSTST
jgi:arginine/serine-rich splicing factor 16